MVLRPGARCFSDPWRGAWSKWIARRCRCRPLLDPKVPLQMRQACEKAGELGRQAEDLQGAAIGRRYETPGILYGEMLDISEVLGGRRSVICKAKWPISQTTWWEVWIWRGSIPRAYAAENSSDLAFSSPD